MKHKGWKIAFGVSWIPASVFYVFWVLSVVDESTRPTLFAIRPAATFLVLIPLIGVITTQAILAHFAFRR